MTEEEKREKAMIEKVLSDEQIKIANNVSEFAKLQQVGISKCYADALYDAGYRKEEKVRKETATRIYEYLRRKEFYDSFPVVDFNEVRNICEESGAEVEE